MASEAKITLKIHGKLPSAFSVPPLITKIKTFLDKLPNDEIYGTTELIEKMKGSEWVKTRFTWGHPALRGYSVRLPQVRYWGNPKAISELMRQTQHESK